MRTKLVFVLPMVLCLAIGTSIAHCQDDSIYQDTKSAYDALLKKKKKWAGRVKPTQQSFDLLEKQIDLLKTALDSMKAERSHSLEKKRRATAEELHRLKVEQAQLLNQLGKNHPKVRANLKQIQAFEDFLAQAEAHYKHSMKHNPLVGLSHSLAKTSEFLKKNPSASKDAQTMVKHINALQDAIRAQSAKAAIGFLEKSRLKDAHTQLKAAKAEKAEMDERLKKTHEFWLKLHSVESEMAQIQKLQSQTKKLERTLSDVSKRTERIEKMLEKLSRDR